MNKSLAIVVGVALALGGGAVAVALLKTGPVSSVPRPALTEGAWTEMAWPFPIDQWGKGKAFRCNAAGCNAGVNIYVRAKVGFCNCVTGISDDTELDRMSDFDLVGEVTPLGAGREISVGRMQGRSRAYRLAATASTRSVISVAFNDRCDMIVATVALSHDRPESIEPEVITFLNSPAMLRWAEIAIGL